jgi:UDPglucose 6-dehydrogenase
LSEVDNINRLAKRDLVRKAKRMLDNDLHEKSIGVWGLAFKANTDDMRESPVVDIVELLRREGAVIKAFDPQAIENAKKILTGIEFAETPEEAVKDANLLMVLTDWDEFKEKDLREIYKLMREPNMVDGRNIYDPEMVKKIGFKYVGVGR